MAPPPSSDSPRPLKPVQDTRLAEPRFKASIPAANTAATLGVDDVLFTLFRHKKKIIAFALFSLQERSTLFVTPGDAVYEGMLIGENSRPGDMDVNPTKEKKLSNIRTKSTDENITLEPPREITLESALEYIEDDELIEITPHNIRLRKRLLATSDRKRTNRETKRDRLA